MAQAQTFIGAHISLTSTSDIRYRGILYGINHQDSTIQLQHVYSMGTEDRRPPAEFLPPNPDAYDFIVFRATEVKDLAVEKHAPPSPSPQHHIHNDPAVIGASVAAATPSPAQIQQTPAAPPVAPSVPPPPVAPTAEAANPMPAPPQTDVPATSAAPSGAPRVNRPHPPEARGRDHSSASVRSAEASLDTIERAIGDLRVNPQPAAQPAGAPRQANNRTRSGPRPRGPGIVPETPFDFERSNAKFNKPTVSTSSVPGSSASADGSTGTPEAASDQASTQFYNKTKSFFDDISSDSKSRAEGGPQMGFGAARSRREEERNKNLSTFGEVAVHTDHARLNQRGRGTGRRRGGGGGGRGSHQQ